MRPRLVLFGDSITEQSFADGGWGAALADRFARQKCICLDCYFHDGLHFTPAGNKILFHEVVKTLSSIGFSSERLPSDLPLFHDIDTKDPMKAFD
ncbi:hypothetical protein PR202_ga24155 [Eleusine coracana subsp. coracana]|uniref:Uncharacterized protein n=1 Tax=Eleusine coracana subsp. coracana TaxID=191504 RepID=A0AAV5D858_ELECO|nr:hypothetical protein PR202_ga24155 [Eleusine coracana subsp. coracana]